MARKVVNRKALREEVEAAERSEAEALNSADIKTEETKAPKAKAPKRKSRTAEAKVVRVKLFWQVVNQAMKPVGHPFPYHQKAAAQKKAEELSQGGKTPHFLHKHREEIAEP